LTRYTVGLLAADTTLDISAARRDLGYRPSVSIDEGIARFLAAWKGARA
jgi:nucleoside-diphosphate-sugar epimerase